MMMGHAKQIRYVQIMPRIKKAGYVESARALSKGLAESSKVKKYPISTK